MIRPRVRIVVERLVLDGVAVPPDRVPDVIEAMTDELYRLALGTGTGWTEGAQSVRAPDVVLAPGTPPANVGRVLGGAVHGALVPVEEHSS